MKAAEAAGSLLSRHDVRVEDVAWQVVGALLALHMELQCLNGFFGDRCEMEGL